MMTKFSFASLFYLLPLLAFSQKELVIRLSQPVFTAGDDIGIVVSNMSQVTPEIIFIELLNKNGELLEIQKTKSNGITGALLFRVPANWQSDWYVIRAYTIWNSTLSIKDLGYVAFPVYNEFEQVNTKEFIDDESMDLSKLNTPFNIQTDKDSYNGGESVQLSLESGYNGSSSNQFVYVVTVFDQLTLDIFQSVEKYRPDLNVMGMQPSIGEGIKEDKLVYIGKTIDDVTGLLGVLYGKEDKKISWISFNDQNEFGFEMDDFLGMRHVQLIGMDPLGGNTTLNLEVLNFSDYLEWPKVDWPLLPMSTQIMSYLEKSRKRKIISDIFNIQSETENSRVVESVPFDRPDRTYVPKDFIRFSDTRDFINEVVSFLKIRGNGEDQSYRVLLERNKLGLHPPLLFLDDYVINDINEILEIDLDKIEKIDLYRKEKSINDQFGSLGKNGVVGCYTKDKNTKPDNNKIGVIKGLAFRNSQIITINRESSPSFSSLLYWDSILSMDENNTVKLVFPVSDDFGEYIIKVEKITPTTLDTGFKTIFLKGRNSDQK